MTRPMGQFNVEQRTKDGMFNATSLLKQWNDCAKMQLVDNHCEELNRENSTYFNLKEIKTFFLNKTTKDFINALISEENLTSEREAYVSTKGRNGATWMHPLLFVKFAMWLNPRFEVKVIKFVYDELMKLRNDAGDNYKLLSASASIFPDVDYKRIAKGLNYIVFGRHYDGIRQSATKEQLKELNKIQESLALSMEMGLIPTFQSLIEAMRTLYNKKHAKF